MSPRVSIVSALNFAGVGCLSRLPTSGGKIQHPNGVSTGETSATEKPLKFNPNITGSLAQAMCAENSKIVYNIVKRNINDIEILNNQKFDELEKSVEKILAKPGEFPHMVVLGYDNVNNGIVWHCSGTLISANIVLTAAHCALSQIFGTPSHVKAGAITLARTNDEQQHQVIKIANITMHPKYLVSSLYHDIAILQLTEKVVYTQWVKPACLPAHFTTEYVLAVASGWAVIDWMEELNLSNLFKQELYIVPHEICKQIFFDYKALPSGILNDRQICAAKQINDICLHDSEGSLAVPNEKHKNIYDVIGITNIERKCHTGVYTRVQRYIDWIEKTAWPEYF